MLEATAKLVLRWRKLTLALGAAWLCFAIALLVRRGPMATNELPDRCRDAGFEVEPSDAHEIKAHIVRPATILHPHTGEKAWFNHAHVFEPNPRASGWAAFAETKIAYLWPSLHLHAATYGNGARIPRRALDAVGNAIARETVSVLLEPTDVLLIDNLVCMHGRARFRGPRKLLVAMA